MKKVILVLLVAFYPRYHAQNNALDFGPFGADVELAYSAALDFDITDKFTIESWVKTTEGYAAIIWSNHEDIIPFVGTEVAVVNGKAVLEIFNDYQNNGIRVETINTVNDGNWHHLAFVYKGTPNASTCEIYIDGISQALNINTNNLSSSTTTTNEAHIGSRNNTTYHANLVLDEMRIWKRVLCAAEIMAHKNCTLIGNQVQLEAYYKFNQGTAGGNNSSVTSLMDSSPNAHTGTLTGFSLSGSNSNWISSTAPITSTCGPYAAGLSISGTNTLCMGMATGLSASGATSYTWQPGNMNNANVNVSPNTSTTYTVYATNSASCLVVNTFSLTVMDCTGLNELSSNENANIYPNPGTGQFIVRINAPTNITVTNSLGQIVHKATLNDNKNTVDLNNLKEGIYFVNGENSSGKWQKKIIIAK